MRCQGIFKHLILCGCLCVSACSQNEASGGGDLRAYRIVQNANGATADSAFAIVAPEGAYRVSANIRTSLSTRGDYDEIRTNVGDGKASLQTAVIEELAQAELGFGDMTLNLTADLDNNTVTFRDKRYYGDSNLDELTRDLNDSGLGAVDLHLQGAAKVATEDSEVFAEQALNNRKAVGRFFKKVFGFIFSHVEAGCTWSSKDGRNCNVRLK